MTREEFKRYAAGTFVIGKSSFDHKMLEAYMDGALLAWDTFNKIKKIEQDQQTFIDQVFSNKEETPQVKQ